MTEWSINCQPSRCARRAAISPPPLPYSREIVTTRMAVMACGFTFIAFPPLVSSSHDKSGSHDNELEQARSVMFCHAERSEASACSSREILRFAQDDKPSPIITAFDC